MYRVSFSQILFVALKSPVYWCNGVLDEFEELASVADCLGVAVEIGPGLGSTSMQIVRDVRIKKTMAVVDLVEVSVEPYDDMTRG